MALDTNLIIGLSTALGAAIGGLFTLLAARRQDLFTSLEREKNRLLRNYLDACRNVESFHKIEEEYSKAMAALTGKSEARVKIEMRDKVENAGGGRPTWSARDARMAINDSG